MKIFFKAPAKINLTLEVLRKLPSGFHELRTIMTKLPDLSDEISVIFNSKKDGIVIKSDSRKMPSDEKNICYKVAKSFLKKTKEKIGLEIRIKKNIPVGAGLGGGSSDGAAVLKILNNHFKSPLSQKQLINLASKIGKDIPFFFSEKNSALIQGCGEKITQAFEIPPLNILLVNPKIHVATNLAYAKLSPLLAKIKRKTKISDSMIAAAKRGDAKTVAKYLHNDFEMVMEKEYPVIKKIKKEILDLGADGSLMSGSGSTVFGIFATKKALLEARKKLKKKYPNFLVK